MKKLTYLFVTALLLLFVGCKEEGKYPDPPYVPEEEVPPVPELGVNLVSDANFNDANLTKTLTAIPIVYGQWVVENNISDNSSFSLSYNAVQGNVAAMTNGTNAISSANARQAFIAQRINVKAARKLYWISFKARYTGNNVATVRLFILPTDADGALTAKYFAGHYNEDPTSVTPPTQKYGIFCKHIPVTAEWKTYERIINFDRTTTSTASTLFGDTVVSTEIDLEKFIVCLSNNTKESTIEFDDISLILAKTEGE